MVIKDLWNLHLSQQPCEKTKEEEALMQTVLDCQEKLLASFADEQKEIFEEYTELCNALGAMAAERAFEKGVSFGTGYILETLGK